MIYSILICFKCDSTNWRNNPTTHNEKKMWYEGQHIAWTVVNTICEALNWP